MFTENDALETLEMVRSVLRSSPTTCDPLVFFACGKASQRNRGSPALSCQLRESSTICSWMSLCRAVTELAWDKDVPLMQRMGSL